MKKRLLLLPFLMACLMFSVFTQAQQEKKELTLAQRAKVNAIKEQYVRGGMPYELAMERALRAFESEQRISTRSRLATPPDSSIWVDRDKDNWGIGNYHPVYHDYTPEDLVKKVLLGDSRAESAISNVKFAGHNWNGTSWTADDRSLHFFENGQYLGIEKGLLLATGPALQAEGTNNSSAEMLGGTSVSSDPDLQKICSDVWSGSVLEFDFIPYTSRVTFDFIFASEEYGDYSNKHTYNDAFGFFVSKADNPVDTINIARFPNDSLVTISNSNWGYRGDESKAFYDANPPDTTGYSAALTWNAGQNGFYVPFGSPIAVNPQWHIPHHTSGSPIITYDGQTVKLEAVADNLVVGEKYHLKLAICNKGDDSYGSAVFLANLNLGLPTGTVDIPYSDIATIDSLGMDADGNARFMYAGCSYPIEMKFTPSSPALYPIDVEISYINIDSTAVTDIDGKPLKNKFQLENVNDIIRSHEIVLSTDYTGFENGQYVGMIVSIAGGGSDTVFYKQLFEEVSWDVKYTMVTEIDKGRLNLGIKGGSPTLHRSIDDGQSWVPISKGFSQWDLLYIGEECDILLYQSFQCCYDTIKIRKPTGTVNVQRYIDIPKVSGVSTNPGIGRHYIDSRKNFTFNAYYAGDPMSVKATGYYSRTTQDLDATAELQADGSYKYTLYKVVEPWTISFEPKTNAGEVSNETLVVQPPVWSSGNTLYVNVSEKSVANIYTLTGVLYKQAEVGGYSTIQLPRGFYIVSLNGSQYKIMIK